MADEMELLSSLDPVPGVSGNPGPPTGSEAPVGREDRVDGEEVIELETTATEERSASRSLLFGLAAAVLLVVGVLGFVVTRDGDDPEADQKVALDEDPPDAQGTPVAAIPVEPVTPGDGIVSLKHPLAATPFAELGDGQRIALTGTNFPPNSGLLIVQCWLVGESGSAETCDVTALEQGSTDVTGSFTANFSVKRYMSIDGQTRDCVESVPGDGCYISVASAQDYNESGVTPIFFSADSGGTPPPIMRADRAEGLLDGDEITISGSGFEPDQNVFLTQCSIGGYTSPGGCGEINPRFEIQADATGAFLVTLPVSRYLLAYEGLVDCAATSCQILTTSAPSTNLVGLSFDPAGPTTGLPDVTITPTDDLIDAQMLNVAIENLSYQQGWVATQLCVQREGLVCGEHVDHEITNGNVDVDTPVARLIRFGSELIDCASENCFMRVTVWGIDLTTVALTFDPSGPAGVVPPEDPTERAGGIEVTLGNDPGVPTTMSARTEGDQIIISIDGEIPWTEMAIFGCDDDGCFDALVGGTSNGTTTEFFFPAAISEFSRCQIVECGITAVSGDLKTFHPFSEVFD